jgi:preprotein translocase SecE subunit
MKLVEYVKDVKGELAHVNFPGKKQTIFLTVFVVVLSLASAIYLGLFDFLFNLAIKTMLAN